MADTAGMDNDPISPIRAYALQVAGAFMIVVAYLIALGAYLITLLAGMATMVLGLLMIPITLILGMMSLLVGLLMIPVMLIVIIPLGLVLDVPLKLLGRTGCVRAGETADAIAVIIDRESFARAH